MSYQPHALMPSLFTPARTERLHLRRVALQPKAHQSTASQHFQSITNKVIAERRTASIFRNARHVVHEIHDVVKFPEFWEALS